MSGVFNEHGVRFMFPENWTMINEASSDAIVDVMLQAPSGAFWTIQTFPGEMQSSALLETAIASLKLEYEDLEVTAQKIDIAGNLGFGFELSFFCLDFLISGRLFAFVKADRIHLVLYQAELREFVAVEPIFRAITTSLLEAGVVPTNRTENN